MNRLRMLTFVFFLAAISTYYLKNESASTIAISNEGIEHTEWLAQHQSVLTPKADQRPADQTFLTFPEWFLVHSPAEQADYFKHSTSTSFPFLSHVDQIWDSYNIASYQIEDHFERNDDYHLMIKVIGSSASVEYSLKAWYELIIGRITQPNQSEPMTQEDQFNADFTQAYVDFIRNTPWYEFDFSGELKRLWTEPDFFGGNFLRKIERKYVLSSELLLKTVYAKLIKLGTRSMYDPASLTTVVLVDSLQGNITQDSNIELLEKFEDNSALLRVPRYAPFNPTAMKIAQAGISFKEIAGNNSAILLSVLNENPSGSGESSNMDAGSNVNLDCKNFCEILFVQPFQSNPDLSRYALVTTVPKLSALLLYLSTENIDIEHIYDY